MFLSTLKSYLPGIFLLMSLSSCHERAESSHSYFDSLADAQVRHLTLLKARISKAAKINDVEDHTVFLPAAKDWKSELDILSTLNDFERPAYRDRYTVKDGFPDTRSNLLVRSFTSNENIPVPEIKFYYYRQLKNIRKIEARLHESNILFSTSRRVSLEFEEFKGLPVLANYTIDGGQKMILNDSVRYSIRCSIAF